MQADARELPFEDASFDLVFSNLMLQWLTPPDAALTEMRRVLKPGGLLLLSSFGPETLRELRTAWEAGDTGVHVNEFIDVHDLGSALARAGFAEPVLDVDRHVHHYAEARTLMRELKALGAHNVDVRRARGLTGRGAFERMTAAYEAQRTPGGLPATWQLVHAVAWAQAEERAFHAVAGEVHIGLAQLRSSLANKRDERSPAASGAAPEPVHHRHRYRRGQDHGCRGAAASAGARGIAGGGHEAGGGGRDHDLAWLAQ